MRKKVPAPFYLTGAWKRVRLQRLRRDGYVCQDCLKKWLEDPRWGAPRRAVLVHHIQPIESHPELALDENNLVSLCDGCHNQRHPERHQGKDRAAAPSGMRVIQV